MPRKAKTLDAKSGKLKEASVSLDDVEASNVLKKQREDKRNDKLTEDLMYGKKAYKRTVTDTMAERDAKGAYLSDFGHKHKIVMEWDMNTESIRDQIFRLTVGDKVVYLSAVELQKYLRWV